MDSLFQISLVFRSQTPKSQVPVKVQQSLAESSTSPSSLVHVGAKTDISESRRVGLSLIYYIDIHISITNEFGKNKYAYLNKLIAMLKELTFNKVNR